MAEHAPHNEGHHPSEHSVWPVATSFGILVVSIGLVTHLAVSAVGGLIILFALASWLWQPWVS